MRAQLLLSKATFLLAALLATTAGNAQNFSWVKSGGLHSAAVTTDAGHNTIVAGAYSGSAQFGSTTLTGYGSTDCFVAKYAPNGAVLWAKGFGGTLYDGAQAVATDAAGNVYVCGYFLSPVISFSTSDTLQVGGAVAVYLVKYSASGAFQWARRGSVPSNLATSAAALRVDASGAVIVGGTFGGSAAFGSTTLTGGSGNLFLVKYSSSGSVLWAKAGVSSSYCMMNGMALDAAGNIYTTGKLGAAVNWGTGAQPISGGEQLYVAKFNSTGALQWMKQEGASIQAGTTYAMYDCGNGVGVDDAGNVYVGGSLVDTVYVHPTTFQILSRQRGVVAKYNSAGTLQWMRKIGGGNEHAVVNGLAVDAAGNPYIVGNYKDTASISGTALPTAASRDVFIARLTPAGGVTWAKTAGSGSADAGAAIAIDADGSVVTAGSFDSVAATFGTVTVTGPGMGNGFVSKQSNTVVTGLAEAAVQPDAALFPNPATTALFIHCGEEEALHASITDATGRVIRMMEVERGIHTLDVSGLAAGTYFIRLRKADGRCDTRRFQKL